MQSIPASLALTMRFQALDVTCPQLQTVLALLKQAPLQVRLCCSSGAASLLQQSVTAELCTCRRPSPTRLRYCCWGISWIAFFVLSLLRPLVRLHRLLCWRWSTAELELPAGVHLPSEDRFLQQRHAPQRDVEWLQAVTLGVEMAPYSELVKIEVHSPELAC